MTQDWLYMHIHDQTDHDLDNVIVMICLLRMMLSMSLTFGWVHTKLIKARGLPTKKKKHRKLKF